MLKNNTPLLTTNCFRKIMLNDRGLTKFSGDTNQLSRSNVSKIGKC